MDRAIGAQLHGGARQRPRSSRQNKLRCARELMLGAVQSDAVSLRDRGGRGSGQRRRRSAEVANTSIPMEPPPQAGAGLA